jgi:hypothetical protein
MQDPGVDRHEWESEMQALEDQLGESPAEALPELDGLVGRMLEATGVGEGEPEIAAEFLAARQVTQLMERGEDAVGPGDVAAAINGYRAVYDHVVASRVAAEE